MCRNRAIILSAVLLLSFIFSSRLFSQLRINEIMAANAAAIFNTSYNYNDYVELYNESSNTINLNGYTITDDPREPDKFVIWVDILLNPGQYFIIQLDKRDYIYDTYIHANFSLDVNGEFFGIYTPSGSVVDSMSFGQQTRDIAYGCLINDPETWVYFKTPTPGQSNNSEYLLTNETAGEVEFSVQPGFYQGSVTVELTATGPSDAIVYTVNGDYPRAASPYYGGPITISENTVIRARSIADGLHPGPISSASYFINIDTPNLPVVSLATDEGNFYNWTYGYYVDGNNGVMSWCSEYPVNWARDWERPLNFDFFTQDGQLQNSQLVGSKIYGGCSRANALRSFSLISREDYGKKGMDYRFYTDKPDVESYKSLVLRNSGSDVVASMLRDGFMQTLVKDRMDLDYQAYQPVLVYLNGEYFALMNLREKMNEHYVASNHGLDPDDIDIIGQEDFVVEGNDSAYQAMLSFISSHSLADPAAYEEMKTIIDVNHYMDYYITNIYYENEDWPQNNIKFWRERKPGAKWRIMLYDTDCGFHLYPRSGNTLTWALRPHPSTTIFVALMENETFRNEFIQRFAAHINTTFEPGRVLPVLDSLVQLITPHIQTNISMYGLPPTYTTWDWHINHIMPEFAVNQPDIARGWIRDYFGINGMYPLSITVNYPGNGFVEVNKVDAGADYSGLHFNDIPVRLKAIPKAGYKFVGWTGDVVSAEKEIYINRSSTTDITALFAIDEPLTGVIINEFVASNDSGTMDEFGEHEDWIELHNTNSFAVDVGGLFLSDSAAYPEKYQIPYGFSESTTIEPYGYLVLWADDDDEQGCLHLPFKLKRSGETILLSQTRGAEKEILDSLSYTEQYTDASFGRDPQENSLWKYLIPTPGAENRASYLDNIYINEFMSSNSTVLQDEWGEYDDWIEIYNDNEFDVDLGGMFLSDDITKKTKFRLSCNKPDSTTIPAKGYLLFWADDSTEQGIRHLNFKLSGAGEQIILTQPGGIDLVDSLSYPDLLADAPWGRIPDGSGSWSYVHPTPNATNLAAIYENIYINEIMASNSNVITDNHGEYDDWIELYNANDHDVNIGGLFITDDPLNTMKYRLSGTSPDSLIIPAYGHLLLWADDSTEQGIRHLNFKLSSQGEFLALMQPDGTTILDSLTFRQQHEDISFGRIEDGNPQMQALIPTPGAANFRADYEGILISEVMASDQTAYPDNFGEYDDWIELYNSNDYPVDIAGLFVSDSLPSSYKYQIPYRSSDSAIISAHDFLILWADNQPEQGILHLDFRLREGGEQVGLFNPDGSVVDTISYGNQYNNFSYNRISNNNWLKLPPSPGEENTIPVMPDILINEYMANNDNRVTDEFGEYDDWIELYNPNDFDVDIGGFYLTDSLNYPDQYRIPSNNPEGTTIPAGGFLVIWTDSDSDQGCLHTNFKLNRKADNIVLSGYDYRDVLVSHSYVKQPKNFATGRIMESDEWIDLPPTPGSSNILPDFSGLYINEIMASNARTIADEHGEYDDWIELYNAGTDLLDIGGLFISDDVEDDSPFRISSEYPDSTTIKPGDYLLIWADDSTEQGILHLDFKLSSSGEEVVIFDLDRITILDSVSYKDIPTDITFGRTQDGGSNWYELATPTPSYSNILTAGEEITFVTSACNYKVYPNPAISHAVFSVETDRATQISIRVYNLSGELVNTVTDGKYPAGSYEFFWELDGSDQSRIPLGVYFYSIETDTISVRDKIIVTN